MKKVVLRNLNLSKDNMLSFEETKKVVGGSWLGEGDGDGEPPIDFPTCICTEGGWAAMENGLCPCWCIIGVEPPQPHCRP